MFARSSGSLINRMHVRRAPFDGLLHLTGQSVYISTTQLLVRRSVFKKIGLFEPRWGSVGDFAWNMLAGLIFNVIHVPATWGGWRVHSSQATAGAGLGLGHHAAKIDEMVSDALLKVMNIAPTHSLGVLLGELEAKSREVSHFVSTLRNTHGFGARQEFVARSFLAGSAAARLHLLSKFGNRKRGIEILLAEEIRRSVERVSGKSVFEDSTACAAVRPKMGGRNTTMGFGGLD